MTCSSTLSAEFQLSIPESVRQAHGWQPGQEFVFIPKRAGVLLMPAPELQALSGIARGATLSRFATGKIAFDASPRRRHLV